MFDTLKSTSINEKQCSLFAQDSSQESNNTLEKGAFLSPGLRKESNLEDSQRAFRYLSRKTDPKTSQLAAQNTSNFKSRHIAKIWTCLKDHGKMNYKEIAKLTGLEPVAVARRRKEMESHGLIQVLGEERNGCQLWAAV